MNEPDHHSTHFGKWVLVASENGKLQSFRQVAMSLVDVRELQACCVLGVPRVVRLDGGLMLGSQHHLKNRCCFPVSAVSLKRGARVKQQPIDVGLALHGERW
jgi:hypothetical protein